MAHKILVVDDQPFMVRLIQHHLERAGYQLIKARNSQEANAAIIDQSPQLLLMAEKAAEVVTAAQPEPSLAPAIPVIRMTDVPATMSEQKESETEVILRKPFSPAKLVAEVRRLLTDKPPEHA